MINKEREQKIKVITICIPTYNRGEKAKSVVTKLLPEIGESHAIKILVLDNASQKENHAYRQIALMSESSPVLDYIRHDENLMGYGNFLACFELADSPLIMISSDEDTPSLEFIKQAQSRLSERPGTAIFRGSIATEKGLSPMNAIQLKNDMYSAGEHALLNYAFFNNYFSGTIYNRQALTELGLVNRLKENLQLNWAYPHLYLELLASAIRDVETSAEICCVEGSAQILEGPAPAVYMPPFSIGARLDQFVIQRDNIREAVALMDGDFDAALFVTLYLHLCEKHLYLINTVNAPMYQKNQINMGFLCESLLPFFLAAIVMCPEAEGFHDGIVTELRRMHEKYMTVWR